MAATSQRAGVIRFGAFQADVSSGELRKNGVKIRLPEQSFQILVMLADNPGHVVTREELRKNLWPQDTFVDFDNGLNSAILRLRNALGDSAETPRFVETLPRRGYRFIGAVQNVPSAPHQELTVRTERAAEQPPEAHRPAKVWIAAGALAGILALLVGLNVGGLRQRFLRTSAAGRIQSLAVLPLENMSGDPGQEYFVDGITDALITDLAQISSLKVISRTSTMRYRGSRKPLPQIAKELGVDGIVEGAVIRSGERVRVDAQLIEASTDRHFWARTYERNLGDVISLQNDVARAIANEIQAKLTPQEQVRLLRAESVDPETYALYLKGRYFWSKRTEDAVRKSINYFQQAIQRSPNYALAYAGLAEAFVVSYDVAPQEQYSAAKAAARRALELDDSLAEAHNALAASLFWYDWDWAGAEKEFQRAIALNPNYAWAHQWYGQFQHAMGRPNWAAEVQRAGELDPLSLVIAGGHWYLESGQYDLAIEYMRKRLELDPDFAGTYVGLGRVYAQKGMYQDAIAHLQKGVDLSGGAPDYLSALGYTYGVSGKRDEALKILRQLALLSKRRYVSPYDIAMVYVGLGKKDLGFDWLQKSVADRSIPLTLKTDERMDSLRSDSRFSELVRRVGLPP